MNGMGRTMQASTVNTTSITSGGNTGAVLNYSPQITINGTATPETLAEFGKLLRQHADEIVAIIRRDADNKARLSFNA